MFAAHEAALRRFSRPHPSSQSRDSHSRDGTSPSKSKAGKVGEGVTTLEFLPSEGAEPETRRKKQSREAVF